MIPHRNIGKFIDLCQGNFGRKIAYTGAEVITIDNVVRVVGNAMSILNYNRPMMRYLYRYYLGDQPINYRERKVRKDINNKVCENHALEVVRFKTSQTYGEAIQYVAKKSAEMVSADVDKLNDYLDSAFAKTRNIQMGTYQSAIGTSYKAVTKVSDWSEENGDIPFGIFIPDPMNTIIVYSQNDGREMLSIQNLKDELNREYYLCYSKKNWFKIQNGKVIESGYNWFDDIPVKEYPNNADRLSDIEICIGIFDAINTVQSERINGIEQFVQAFMKFKNCEIDENTFLKMCDIGAIAVKDVGSGLNSDVDIMTAELNQTQTQVAKDDLYHQALIIEGMPDRQQNTGGDTGNAVYLRNGWDFAEKRALLDEPFIEEAEIKFAKVILNVLRKENAGLRITVRDFEVRITRNPTDNMLVKAQALDYLIKNKIHPLIACTTCGLFGDPQKVYEMSWEYMKEKYKSEAELQAEITKAQNLLNNPNNQE